MPTTSSPVLVKACLNGGRSREEHPGVPITPEALARDAQRCVAAGAAAIHIHPRDADGAQTLDAGWCAAAAGAIRAACPGIPVSVTTGAWIEPDPVRRLDQVRGWEFRPEFASVNFSEAGIPELCELLFRLGIQVEAGVASLADVQALVASGLSGRCARVLVEPHGGDPTQAVAASTAFDAALERAGIRLRQVHHGDGLATWAVLRAALGRGRDIRIGLEDTLILPNGAPAWDNAALVAMAVQLAHECGRSPVPPGVAPARNP